MITLSKEVSRSIENGAITQEELSRILVEDYSAKNIADSLAEAMLEKREETPSPIVIEKDDYDRIISLFRVKGLRVVDGQVIEETRGRKKKGE